MTGLFIGVGENRVTLTWAPIDAQDRYISEIFSD